MLSRLATALLLVALLAQGCSIRRLAVNKVADALAGTGTTFTSDDDPELVGDALPFGLKLMESLLAESPAHDGLLLALTRNFTQYAYAFVQFPAELREAEDLEGAREQFARARRLYLRARGYGLRGLEGRLPGFTNALAADPAAAVRRVRREDVPLLFWTAASWAGAIALAKDDPGLVSDLPTVEALMDRALGLDEAWELGAIHEFMIVFEMSRTTRPGDPVPRARAHFERALELSGGRLAGPFLNWAESVCIPTEDRVGFEQSLRAALAIDPDVDPPNRLANLLLQRRARWLLGQVDNLFLPALEDAPNDPAP
ncbi:MAG: TRAP transporter TatT component family protein [Limisphaerales bacterium]